MRLLVDTNRFADLAANDRQAHQRLNQASELWLSVITVGELLAGLARGNRRRENEQRLADLLNLQGVGVLLLDDQTPRIYANVWNDLRANGRRIPSNDLWIAALAIQHDLTLDSPDRHFQFVPGLKLLDAAS